MRIIHNTTFIIDEEIEKEWIPFMQENYVQTLREQKACEDILFTKVSIDQPEGKTYSIQVFFKHRQQKEEFLKRFLPAVEEEIIRRYANHYVCFSSELTEI